MIRKILKYLGFTLLFLLLVSVSIYLFVRVNPHQQPGKSDLREPVADLSYLADLSFHSSDVDFNVARSMDSSHLFSNNPSKLSRLDLETLDEKWGKHKTIPPEIRLPTLLALRQYPELQDKRITFHYAPAMIPMSSRPAPTGVFQSADNRHYHVYISSESNEGMEPILIHNLPFNAQVAIMAHELGHTLFYTKLSGVQVAKFALLYALDTEARAAHEKGTDSLVVYRGLGPHLYEYAAYVRSDRAMGADYVEDEGFSDKFYLKPSIIKSTIESIKQ